ncbi:MAG: electron transport complex subunit RsxG [Gammaproteobacteria bacterium]|nr:electron transport complex subunit RsxG [Gammaproteobacteria bacterium]
MITTAVILAGFAIAGTGLVAFTYKATQGKIAEAERDALLRSLHSVVKPEKHDNQLFADLKLVTSPRLLGSEKPMPAFRARKNGEPVAVILTAIAPDGYNGDIKLLIGINYDGTLSGVRVLTHRETPGLGDDIEMRRSDWILGFNGHSMENPSHKQWKVKRDGGYFDQFTGATITPRAVVKAVHNALQYYAQHKDELFQ